MIDTDKLIAFLKSHEEKKSINILDGEKIFLQFLKQSRREETYRHHLQKLRMMNKFFTNKNVTKTEEITTDLVLNMIDWLKSVGNKNSTINKFLVTIKYMLNYLTKIGKIEGNQINVQKLQSDESRYKTIDSQTLSKVLKHIESFELEKKLYILLLASTGIRRTELTYLLIKDIEWENNRIFLSRTKGKHARYIYLNSEILTLIENHLINSMNQKYIFETLDHKSQIPPSYIDHVFARIKKDLDLEELSPHMFRHTYATTLLKQGADVESIRLLLGHQDYSVINRYLHLNDEELAKLSVRANPVEYIANRY